MTPEQMIVALVSTEMFNLSDRIELEWVDSMLAHGERLLALPEERIGRYGVTHQDVREHQKILRAVRAVKVAAESITVPLDLGRIEGNRN